MYCLLTDFLKINWVLQIHIAPNLYVGGHDQIEHIIFIASKDFSTLYIVDNFF